MVLKDGDIRSFGRITRSRGISDKENKFKSITTHIEENVDPTNNIERREDPMHLKGQYGVFAKQRLCKGSFICEYAGDLIDIDEAARRNVIYDKKQKGSYMFYFEWKSKCLCVDATEPTCRLGRLVNHSRKRPNARMEVFTHQNKPYLILTARKDIEPNEEILYDYGERDREVIKMNPWLQNT